MINQATECTKILSLIIDTIKGENAEEEFAAVTEFYTNDFEIDQLRLHLQVLATNYLMALE